MIYFDDLEREIMVEPYSRTWKLKLTPGAAASKDLENFIAEAEEVGILNLIPYTSYKFELIAFKEVIKKSISIYTLKEWREHNGR